MKIIQTLELNEDLANIKQIEHTILTDKLSFVIKSILAAVALSIACYSIWGFVMDSISTLPPDLPFTDKAIHVVIQITRNLLISASICFAVTGILKGIKYISSLIIRN